MKLLDCTMPSTKLFNEQSCVAQDRTITAQCLHKRQHLHINLSCLNLTTNSRYFKKKPGHVPLLILYQIRMICGPAFHTRNNNNSLPQDPATSEPIAVQYQELRRKICIMSKAARCCSVSHAAIKNTSIYNQCNFPDFNMNSSKSPEATKQAHVQAFVRKSKRI